MRNIDFVAIVLFTIHLAPPLCYGSSDTNYAMTNDQLADYIQACLAKTKLSQGFFESDNENLNLISKEKKSCFLACMFRKSGIIQYDGSVRSAGEDEDPATAEAIDRCSAEAKSDICKLAWCLSKTEKFSIPVVYETPRYDSRGRANGRYLERARPNERASIFLRIFK